jgi:hypothetical protein
MRAVGVRGRADVGGDTEARGNSGVESDIEAVERREIGHPVGYSVKGAHRVTEQ